VGTPELPAEAVIVVGESETLIPFDDELELELPQPVTANPNTASTTIEASKRIFRRRQPISPAASTPAKPKAARSTALKPDTCGCIILAFVFNAARKAIVLFPLLAALAHTVDPRYTVSVWLTELVPVTLAFEIV
jgi:hypothetical protein